MFSQESSQAIFDMGDVELIELKTSTIHCPSCHHYVFEGTLLCNCGKLLELDPDAINRSKEAFEILKPFRASPISTRGAKCGFNSNFITTKPVTHFEALQKSSEDLRQSGTDAKMMRLTGSLSLPIVGRTHGFDTWITVYISVSTTMRRNSKEQELCTYFIYAVLTKTDRHHLYRRDQGTGKRKTN